MKSIFSLPFVALLSWKLASEVLASPASSETGPAENCLTSFIKQFRSYWQVPVEQMVNTDAGVAPSNGFPMNANFYPQADGDFRGVNRDAKPLLLTNTNARTSFNQTQKYIHPDGDKSKCLGASSDSNGARVELFDCPKDSSDPPANILWTIDNGLFRVFSNRCLDDTGGVTKDGQKMQIWTCGHKNQIWHVRDDGGIELSETNKCLDNTDGKMVVGNRVQIWSCTGDPSQKWTISNPGQDYEIRQAGGYGLCLTAERDEDGEVVGVEPCDKSLGQTWNPEGGVLKVYGDKCLDVPDGSTHGTPLQIKTCVDGNKNQKWTSPTILGGFGEGKIEWTGSGYCAFADMRIDAGVYAYNCSWDDVWWRYILAC